MIQWLTTVTLSDSGYLPAVAVPWEPHYKQLQGPMGLGSWVWDTEVPSSNIPVFIPPDLFY